jgi:hypothetical protein
MIGVKVAEVSTEEAGRLSFHPIRQNLQSLIGIVGIVRGQMHAEVVQAAHIAMHHKRHRHCGLLSRLEDRRTDGRNGRSTANLDFDEGLRGEAQRLIAGVRDLERYADGLAQLHIAQIDFLPVSHQFRCAAYLRLCHWRAGVLRQRAQRHKCQQRRTCAD